MPQAVKSGPGRDPYEYGCLRIRHVNLYDMINDVWEYMNMIYEYDI